MEDELHLLVCRAELVSVDFGKLVVLVDNLDELRSQSQYLDGVASQNQQRRRLDLIVILRLFI